MNEGIEREKIQLVRDLILVRRKIQSVSSNYFDDGGVLDVASGTVKYTQINSGPTVEIKFSCGIEVTINDVSERGVSELQEIIEGIYYDQI